MISAKAKQTANRRATRATKAATNKPKLTTLTVTFQGVGLLRRGKNGDGFELVIVPEPNAAILKRLTKPEQKRVLAVEMAIPDVYDGLCASGASFAVNVASGMVSGCVPVTCATYCLNGTSSVAAAFKGRAVGMVKPCGPKGERHALDGAVTATGCACYRPSQSGESATQCGDACDVPASGIMRSGR